MINLSSFFNEYFEYYEGSVDFVKDELTKNKSIKKITFEFFDSGLDFIDKLFISPLLELTHP